MDGSTVDFSNWDDNQGSTNTTKNCVKIDSNAEWTDDNCINPKQFICQSKCCILNYENKRLF